MLDLLKPTLSKGSEIVSLLAPEPNANLLGDSQLTKVNALPEVRTPYDAGSIARDTAAYQNFVDAIPVTEADVNQKARMIVYNLTPDTDGVTTDHYLASTINDNPEWERIS